MGKNRVISVPNWLVWGIIIAVTVAWVANVGARFFVMGYEPNAGVDTIMLAVVGFLLATRSHDDDDDDTKEVPDK